MSGRTQPFRLASGGLIDRSRPLRFTFEGRPLTGYAGDTLASALLANGVRLVGRSFKYHRPRGLIAAGAEEPNALVQLGHGARSTPNVPATEIPLYEGLKARPVNCWPSSRFDVGAINSLLSSFLPAGFYYKTFMWPHWRLFEGAVRRAAGLGRASAYPDPDRYESRFAHCDVLVVGSGPAGLAAARAAAATGARVILAERDGVLGGSLIWNGTAVDGLTGAEWPIRAAEEIASAPEAMILRRTIVVGYHDHNSLTMVQSLNDEAVCASYPAAVRYRLWTVRAGRVVLATGAVERPLVFPDNDRPGIMLASAVSEYVRRYAVAPGTTAVVITNNDDAYRTALDLSEAGGEVLAVVDTRAAVSPRLLVKLYARGIPSIEGGEVTATRGAKQLEAIRLSAASREWWVGCDLLAMSGGFNPTVHLFSQSGGQLRFDQGIAAYVPERSVQAEQSVGAAAGVFCTRSALKQGHAAGLGAAADMGFSPRSHLVPPNSGSEPEDAIEPCWEMGKGQGTAFVDFQNDVTAADIALSARENFVSVEHLKRYTTLGMATDQGKTANVNGLAILAGLTGRSIEQTGHTRYRFPYAPVALSAMAGAGRGELFRPVRRLPSHRSHEAAGATFEEYGGWLRPSCYACAGEVPSDAAQREALAVRQHAGLFDGSPLGKIEVKGPDAAAFLDFIYANTVSTLAAGRIRYGLMLNELGVVIDDGVVTRLSADHFLVGTTSGGAERIAAWMEEWLQCEWLGLDVLIAPVTSSWGVVTLSGPKARDVLRAAGADFPIDAETFPHMSFKEGTVAGFAARVFRVSYTGELSFEINVPAGETPRLWQALLLAGAGHETVPVGVEAWMLLRTEKGYLHVGSDTDGNTTALDLGWGHVLRRKSDFVGKRSLMRPGDRSGDRLQFVGLATAPDDPPLPVGAHLIGKCADDESVSDGYVTSSAYSPTLGRGVALGMVRAGASRKGERVVLRTDAGIRHATIADPAFYDPAGERLHG